MLKVKNPSSGQKIRMDDSGTLMVPNNPIIPYIEGDGIGVDIWAATVRVLDKAVSKSYPDKKIEWLEVYAGEKANNQYG